MSTYVCDESEIQAGKCNTFTVNGKKIVIVKTDNGLYATDNKCPHMGLPLTKAKVEGGEIECHFHRARFNIETGNVVQWASFPPVIVNAINAFKKEKPMVIYPVTIEDGKISVTC